MRADSTPTEGGAGPIRLPSWAYATVTVVSLLIGVTAVVRGTSAILIAQDSDLTNFFLKSASYILQGHPWEIYAARGSGLTSTYPNFNPPLSMFLLAPLLGLANALHAVSYGAQITVVSLPFVPLIPVLAYITLRTIRRLYPEMPETQQFLAFAVIALSPLTWQSITPWYHVEQPLMLCLLICAIAALQAHHELLGGVLAGLAFLTRTTALMPLVAVGVLLLVQREWRGLTRFGGAAAVIALVGFIPFFLFDPKDTIYSLVTWRGSSAIGGNSIWSIFAYSGTDSSIRHLLNGVAEHLDTYSVLLFIVVVAFFAARRGISAYSTDVWAIVTIGALAVPMLTKTVWPYYYLEPFVLLLIWEFATMYNRRGGVWRWPLLSFSYLCVTATLSQYIGLRSVGYLDRVSVGLLEFSAMLAFVALIWVRIRAGKPLAIGTAVAAGPGRKAWRLGQGSLYEPTAAPAAPVPPFQSPMEPDQPSQPLWPPDSANRPHAAGPSNGWPNPRANDQPRRR